MKLNFLLLFLFLSIPASFVFGQTEKTIQQLLDLRQQSIEDLKKVSYVTNGSVYEHSFYIEEGWQNSYIMTTNDQLIYFNGRYNVLKKSIEVKIGEELRIIKKDKVKIAQIGETTLLPLLIEQSIQVNNNIYLEVLSVGNIHLLSSYHMSYKMELGQSLSMQANGKKVYYVEETLYYTTDFQHFKEVKKREVFDIFINKAIEMEAFIKGDKLKLNNKMDLIKIFNHYNRLYELNKNNKGMSKN